MVDRNKRKTLFSLGGLAAAPVVTGMIATEVAHAGMNRGVEKNQFHAISDEFLSGQRLQFVLHTESDEPYMRVTNMTDALEILRHVHPGVIQSGGKAYDLNASLSGSAYAIGAKRSRIIPIKRVSSAAWATEPNVTIDRYPVRIASVLDYSSPGSRSNNTASTSQAFFV